jgi:hypothetical protein
MLVPFFETITGILLLLTFPHLMILPTSFFPTDIRHYWKYIFIPTEVFNRVIVFTNILFYFFMSFTYFESTQFWMTQLWYICSRS